MFRRICTLLILVCLANKALPQGFLTTQGDRIIDSDGNNFIIRGMGLGGWMVQEGYMLQTAGFAGAQHEIREAIEELIGPEKTEQFYQAWLANHMTKTDVDSLKSWGFNAVRLPMHYNLFTLPIEEEPVPGENTWLETGFTLTDQLIEWCASNEMYVILDLHAAPGGQGYEESISDYNPVKPSLWESALNQEKTVALWKRIAERYKNEVWVGGYDLINEPNWDMNNNQELRDLYEEITDAIRAVDQNHIIFIEGNWFANDFTGLTPPWDDNMVYSPHKYWTFNDQASIDWVLTLRNQYNVPLFLGESGENSNVWFRDAIELFENNNIGWAWWPLKKVDAVAGPLTWRKSEAYQALLDYWNGTGAKPSASEAETALTDLAEGMRIENLFYHKDVTDAMFRQVRSEEPVPYQQHVIPGILYPSDFDLGTVGTAYFDQDHTNYHITTGAYTVWNNGHTYRNDGVDIELSSDNILTNGYNIGWTDKDEWMQYTTEVTEAGVYDVTVRVASAEEQGRFHFELEQTPLTPVVLVPNTGGWQQWESLTISGIILEQGIRKIRFMSDAPGFNLGGMEFIRKGATTDVPASFVQAVTGGSFLVTLSLNKSIDNSSVLNGFELSLNGAPVSISSAELVADRSIRLSLTQRLSALDDIRISYAGESIVATDGTLLSHFSDEPVLNNLATINSIPGRVEAEAYEYSFGIQLENTSDEGGGQNIGYLDVGDFADYLVDVPESGDYFVDYRTASESESGAVRLELINADESGTTLHEVTFPPTGDWQNWTTTRARATLPQGQFRLRMTITAPLFNINWLEFSRATVTSLDPAPEETQIQIYPNPARSQFKITGALPIPQNVDIFISDLTGRLMNSTQFSNVQNIELEITSLNPGMYLITVQPEYGPATTRRIIINK